MSQASYGPEEPSDGQRDQGVRDIQRNNDSSKRARTSVEEGSPSEQLRQLQETQAGPAAVSSFVAPGDRTLSGLNHDNRPEFSQGLRQPPLSAPSTVDATPGATGPTSSMPVLISQRPLGQDNDASRRRTNSPTGKQSAGKRSPPRRPPRPSNLSPFIDPPEISHTPASPSPHSPQSQVPPLQYWENDFQRPATQTPNAPDSTDVIRGAGNSLISSSADRAPSIPKFHPPPIVPPSRRTANLGPPPSARRGASSYYLQASYVTPIPEEQAESMHKSKGSYASSHAIPSSWDSGPPDLDIGEGPGEEEEEEDSSGVDDGRESNGDDHDEASGLVRQASLGKRHKPALTTIRSSEMLRKDPQTQAASGGHHSKEANRSKTGLLTQARTSNSPSSTQHPEQALRGGTGLLDPSSSSNESLLKMSNTPSSRSLSLLASADDPRIVEILGGLEKGGALDPRATKPTQLSGDPGQSNMGLYTVSEPDGRNSLTSLPELIRRATRLASVLDRGRTASRLGLPDSDDSGPGTEKVSSRECFD